MTKVFENHIYLRYLKSLKIKFQIKMEPSIKEKENVKTNPISPNDVTNDKIHGKILLDKYIWIVTINEMLWFFNSKVI